MLQLKEALLILVIVSVSLVMDFNIRYDTKANATCQDKIKLQITYAVQYNCKMKLLSSLYIHTYKYLNGISIRISKKKSIERLKTI